MAKRKRFILASGSPRRRSLLQKAGYKFLVKPSRVHERFSSKLSPPQIVKTLALRKAYDIAKKYPDDIVLGADTLVFLGKKVIGKPRNKRHAVQILKALSGRWQKVLTGVAVVWNGGKKKKISFASSSVKLRKLTPKDIAWASNKHLDKAGAYAIQEKRDPFVERQTGDYDNVVGLPVRVVKKLLRLAR